MSEVEVRPVAGSGDLDTWVCFPRDRVYGKATPWVPPLDSDLRRALNGRKNPFFRHGEALPLLARDGSGRPVGRVLAHVYRRHNVRHQERTAFFGYFECVDDQAVCDGLISAAARYGEERGCTLLRGPFNMTAMQEMGVLVDGFEEPPAVDETYTAPYYPALLEGAGLQRTFCHTTFRVGDLAQVQPDASLEELHREKLRGGDIRVRPADLRDWQREIETLRELLNDSFYANPHFVPITREEFQFQLGPYRRLIDPAIALVAEIEGVPCGFVITVPDYNPLLKRMNGRLGPRSLFSFLRGRSRVRDACLIIMGVQRQLQGQGVMRLLHAELVRALQRRGYRRLTITWVSDGNARSLASIAALGGRPLHRLTLFEGPIPLAGRPPV